MYANIAKVSFIMISLLITLTFLEISFLLNIYIYIFQNTHVPTPPSSYSYLHDFNHGTSNVARFKSRVADSFPIGVSADSCPAGAL